MRICEVMSSPVVTVQPDTQLKDVAATLVEHGINAAPVLDASDRLVGSCPRRTSSRWRPHPAPARWPAGPATRSVR